ncbi:HlyD family secretion protein [Vibrio viridaestus]|uniref:HlyD family secretion protein n=1 Tax=Vibrio viridaestus TaxID=2487322 RepID=A0A3N9TK62_9VIBR|nr:efflux RND transporter periplasmic adaptor subunit [Vibrio viridaestus]RQW64719.1 HlyD family secretion protein [Vibrio viridaestus]
MKRDIYAYITTVTLVVAAGFSLFLVISDNLLPFTTQATLKTTSVDVVPEVKGYIKDVFVKEGQHVEAGTPLFVIDKSEYEIDLQRAQATYLQAQSRWDKAQTYLKRVRVLSHNSSVSQEAYDDAYSDERAAKAAFMAAEADRNLAKLNLDRTLVKAKGTGIVTNLTYSKGMYVSPTTPVIHLVKNNDQWLEVDFTEKGLSALKTHNTVNIVYDAIPNQVYQGTIVSIDHAISSGLSAKNQLGQISNETRWIRPQQKIRVRVQPNQRPQEVVAGSRASVMVRDTMNVSDVWMTVLSWFRFVY